MDIIKLHHIQLAMPVGREQEARVFYEDILGIPEVPKPENLKSRGGVWFESGEIRVHLGVEKEFVSAKKAHPAFLVNSLDNLIENLHKAGFSAVKDLPLEGFDRVYVNDPFGNRIELLQELCN
jgi:catechol 2,3-dioxygenase-like lactoylglutathione lyase family enzyme